MCERWSGGVVGGVCDAIGWGGGPCTLYGDGDWCGHVVQRASKGDEGGEGSVAHAHAAWGRAARRGETKAA